MYEKYEITGCIFKKYNVMIKIYKNLATMCNNNINSLCLTFPIIFMP